MDDPLLAAFKTKRIHVYRNGDAFSAAKMVIVNHRLFKNWEQFLHHVALEINLVGAVRRMYQLLPDASNAQSPPQGHRINALHEIKDGGIYVASGTETFKRIHYGAKAKATADMVAAARATGTTRSRQVGASTTTTTGRFAPASKVKDDLHDNLFDANSKGYTLFVFRNGDFQSTASKLLLNYRNCRSFSQFLTELNITARPSGGAVRRAVDIKTGKLIATLHDLTDGMNIAAIGGNEAFKRVRYRVVEGDTIKVNTLMSPATKVLKTDETPVDINVFPNGDPYHIGLRIPVTTVRYPTFDKLIAYLNQHLHRHGSRASKLYTISGFPITNIDGLANNGSYISVAEGDVFRAIRYNINSITTPVLSEEELNREKMRQERLQKVTLPAHPAPHTVRKPAAARFAWGNTSTTTAEHSISHSNSMSYTPASPPQVLVIQHEYPESVPSTAGAIPRYVKSASSSSADNLKDMQPEMEKSISLEDLENSQEALQSRTQSALTKEEETGGKASSVHSLAEEAMVLDEPLSDNETEATSLPAAVRHIGTIGAIGLHETVERHDSILHQVTTRPPYSPNLISDDESDAADAGEEPARETAGSSEEAAKESKPAEGLAAEAIEPEAERTKKLEAEPAKASTPELEAEPAEELEAEPAEEPAAESTPEPAAESEKVPEREPERETAEVAEFEIQEGEQLAVSERKEGEQALEESSEQHLPLDQADGPEEESEQSDSQQDTDTISSLVVPAEQVSVQDSGAEDALLPEASLSESDAPVAEDAESAVANDEPLPAIVQDTLTETTTGSDEQEDGTQETVASNETVEEEIFDLTEAAESPEQMPTDETEKAAEEKAAEVEEDVPAPIEDESSAASQETPLAPEEDDVVKETAPIEVPLVEEVAETDPASGSDANVEPPTEGEDAESLAAQDLSLRSGEGEADGAQDEPVAIASDVKDQEKEEVATEQRSPEVVAEALLPASAEEETPAALANSAGLMPVSDHASSTSLDSSSVQHASAPPDHERAEAEDGLAAALAGPVDQERAAKPLSASLPEQLPIAEEQVPESEAAEAEVPEAFDEQVSGPEEQTAAPEEQMPTPEKQTPTPEEATGRENAESPMDTITPDVAVVPEAMTDSYQSAVPAEAAESILSKQAPSEEAAVEVDAADQGNQVTQDEVDQGESLDVASEEPDYMTISKEEEDERVQSADREPRGVFALAETETLPSEQEERTESNAQEMNMEVTVE